MLSRDLSTSEQPAILSQFLVQAQVAGWCQDMCLNRARQRRRHRRAIEDWFHLCEHALTADASPSFQQWLQTTSSAWHWPQDEDDSQVCLG